MEDQTPSRFIDPEAKGLIWDIDPILFELGIIEIRYYGVLFATGLILAYYLAAKFFELNNMSRNHAGRAILIVGISTLVFAHLAHLVFYEPHIFSQGIEVWGRRLIQIGNGLASHGGIFGVFVGTLIFIAIYKVPFLKFADIAAVSGIVTGVCIRIGNFFNSEIIGRPIEGGADVVPWAIIFARLGTEANPAVAVHPSQLYEAVALIVIFAILYPWYRQGRHKRRDGFFLALLFVLYFTARFLLEYTRVYQSQLVEEGALFTMGQYLSMPFVFLGLVLLFLPKWGRAWAIRPGEKDTRPQARTQSKQKQAGSRPKSSSKPKPKPKRKK